MPRGVVQWCDPGRGLAMVREASSGDDVCAERSTVHHGWPLATGEQAIYDVTVDGDGMRTDNVRRLGQGRQGSAREVTA